MYLGRVIGFGLDEKERPVALYAFSDAKKNWRKAYRMSQTVSIFDEKRTSHHHAMVFGSDGVVYVADGHHVDFIQATRSRITSMENAVKDGLEHATHFKDSFRLAAAIDGFRPKPMHIGVKAEDHILVNACSFIEPGHLYYISSAEHRLPGHASIPSSVSDSVGKMDVTGDTAQELADNLFDWMDQGTVYCTVAAVFEDRKWENGFRNREK